MGIKETLSPNCHRFELAQLLHLTSPDLILFYKNHFRFILKNLELVKFEILIFSFWLNCAAIIFYFWLNYKVALPNQWTLSHKSPFIQITCNLWNVLPSSSFPESYHLPSFNSKINKIDLISLLFAFCFLLSSFVGALYRPTRWKKWKTFVLRTSALAYIHRYIHTHMLSYLDLTWLDLIWLDFELTWL